MKKVKIIRFKTIFSNIASSSGLAVPSKSARALLMYAQHVMQHCVGMIKSVLSQEGKVTSLEEFGEWKILQVSLVSNKQILNVTRNQNLQ